MQRTFPFLVGLLVTLVVAPIAAWWTLSVHEPHCEWGEPFWTGDLPVGEGAPRGLLLGSSRMGADVDTALLAERTGLAWQRIARHTLTGNALPPTYPALLGSSAVRPGLDVLVVEVNPLLYDQTSCGRPAAPNVPLAPAWTPHGEELGVENRASALAMALLPHRWLAGSGRRHDLVEHAKHPGHALRALGDLAHGARQPMARWPGEPAPERTEANAWKRREFLLGQSMDAWVPRLHQGCLEDLATTVRVADAQRTFLVVLPMHPMFRGTIEPEYASAARVSFRELAGSLPRTALVDLSARFDGEPDRYNDFDHLTAAGAERFTGELAELFQ